MSAAPLVGTAAAIGLVLFFVCAVYTHLRAGDYSPQLGLAVGFLGLAVRRAGARPAPDPRRRLRRGPGQSRR